MLTSDRPKKAPGKSAFLILRSGAAKTLLVLIGLLSMSGARANDTSVAVSDIPALASGADLSCVSACAAPAAQNAPPPVIVYPNRLLAGPAASQKEPAYPFFKLDWSLGLRGSYKTGTSGSFYSATIAPDVSLTHTGLRSQYVLGAKAALTYDQNRTVRFAAGKLSASGQYALDRVTKLSGSAALAISQDDPNAPGMDQIVTTPLILDLGAQGGISRQFSRLRLELKGSLLRRNIGQTTLLGNVVQNNISGNTTKLGAGLRASYKLTPIISAFTQGNISHDWFDAPSPNSALYQNGQDLKGTIGLQGKWRGILGAQISVGYGLRRFDNASISPLASVLYGLELSYTPNKTLKAGASFSSTINPENIQNGNPASVSYTAMGNIGLALTSTLRLRALASANWAVPADGSATKTSYSTGLGADFTLNRQTNINLDYLYTRAQRPPAPIEKQQALTLGMTFSR